MEEKIYANIGIARLINIRVILDDKEVIYEGMVDNAPGEIKNLKYSKIENNNPVVFYVYSKFN